MQFQDFFQRVTRATEIKSQKELADLLGVGSAAITLAKKRGVPKAWSLKIASIFGLNPAWLEKGSGPMHQAGREETFYVPKVSARACAGGGSLEVRDNVIGEIPFHLPWVQRKGSPGNMVVMEVIGDSMSPELEEGDNVLIDLDQREILRHALYVVGLEDTLQVKRLESAPNLVMLLSTNHRYSPITLQGDEIDTLRIIGRVLWSSREYV